MAPRNIIKRKYRLVDQWLENIGYYRKSTAHDETCLFRAISEQLFMTQIHHLQIRTEVVNFMRQHIKELSQYIDEMYIDHLEKHLVICGEIELSVCSLLYKRDIVIFNSRTYEIMNITKRKMDKQFLLCLICPDHYDSVFQMSYIENAAFCQSITYTMLYENVFNIGHTETIVNLMLHQGQQTNDTSNVKSKNDIEKKKNEKKQLYQSIQDGLAPFSFKVAKALDVNIYRNIEYDCWIEVRRELRYKQWYKGGDDFTEGVQCYVKLSNMDNNDNAHHLCYIQKVSQNDEKNDTDLCLVYVVALAQTVAVRRHQLMPLPQAKPWPLPLRSYKNIIRETITNSLDKNAVSKLIKSTRLHKNLEMTKIISSKSLKKTNEDTEKKITTSQPAALKYTVTPNSKNIKSEYYSYEIQSFLNNQWQSPNFIPYSMYAMCPPQFEEKSEAVSTTPNIIFDNPIYLNNEYNCCTLNANIDSSKNGDVHEYSSQKPFCNENRTWNSMHVASPTEQTNINANFQTEDSTIGSRYVSAENCYPLSVPVNVNFFPQPVSGTTTSAVEPVQPAILYHPWYYPPTSPYFGEPFIFINSTTESVQMI